MSDDQFTKLFKYMQDFRKEVTVELARANSRIDSVYGLLDAHAKRMEILDQERLAINRQLFRHEEWIERAAPVIKVDFRV